MARLHEELDEWSAIGLIPATEAQRLVSEVAMLEPLLAERPKGRTDIAEAEESAGLRLLRDSFAPA